ncbi:ArsR/SmtB family transcription factor [Neisseria chenwenguii]|uniref:Transcriptional regulator n=1 Tax=Neisseria chenwenguii TaxID=1853278 RepID=A0A220S0K2_9NEIS|nr:metalloregulator ArsR/SmtB family transcription factor [Neisseria chenwenguii]ASK26896.1 transcriptional regulator [Neisseria chenwenguii]ROV56691.1 ArsR family transcriptional regulator [Neisseria chenwenguii]
METNRLSALLKLIANPDRMGILLMLRDGECSVAELCETLGATPTAVSAHLHKMRTEGLVDFTRYHRILEYRLVSEEARILLDTVAELKNREAA